jgi:hypothetical protein
MSQFGFAESNEIRDKQAKNSASRVLVFIYFTPASGVPADKKFGPPELVGFQVSSAPR